LTFFYHALERAEQRYAEAADFLLSPSFYARVTAYFCYFFSIFALEKVSTFYGARSAFISTTKAQ